MDIPSIGAGYLSPIKSQLSPALSNADPGPGRDGITITKISHGLKISPKLLVKLSLIFIRCIGNIFLALSDKTSLQVGEQKYSVDI